MILQCKNCLDEFDATRQRRFCYECFPIGKGGRPDKTRVPHTCQICGTVFRGRERRFCYDCYPEGFPSTYVIRKHLKPKFGGKCVLCGYDKCLDALDFHHKDPNEKEFNLSDISVWEEAVREAEKCILICSNCHREIHSREELS